MDSIGPTDLQDDSVQQGLLLPTKPIVDVFAFFHRHFAKLIHAITEYNRADSRLSKNRLQILRAAAARFILVQTKHNALILEKRKPFRLERTYPRNSNRRNALAQERKRIDHAFAQVNPARLFIKRRNIIRVRHRSAQIQFLWNNRAINRSRLEIERTSFAIEIREKQRILRA